MSHKFTLGVWNNETKTCESYESEDVKQISPVSETCITQNDVSIFIKKFNIQKEIIEKANLLLDKVRKKGISRGRNGDILFLACIYIIANQQGMYGMLGRMSETLQINKKHIYQMAKAICLSLNIQLIGKLKHVKSGASSSGSSGQKVDS